MFRFVALFAFISCAFAGTISNDLGGRIVNGEDTTIQDHPYQVSLQNENGFHFCGGSIVNNDTIVTAAHCLKDKDKFNVRLGSTEYNVGGILVPVRAFKIHELYNPGTKMYDVAILKLAFPVRESSTIRFIKLASATPPTGTPAVVTGWGSKCSLFCIFAPKILQAVEVDVVDEDLCSSEQFKYGNRIRYTMLCGYGLNKDSCQGDSGGPMVASNELVGVVSWGIGCGSVGYPGVYCDIATVYSWIEESIKTFL